MRQQKKSEYTGYCKTCGGDLPYNRWVYCSDECAPYTNNPGEKVIYFIQQGDNGPVKIGASKNLEKRLYMLQSHNPDLLFLRASFPIVDGLECSLQERFKDLHIRGEWYKYEEPLVSYMRELPMRFREDGDF